MKPKQSTSTKVILFSKHIKVEYCTLRRITTQLFYSMIVHFGGTDYMGNLGLICVEVKYSSITCKLREYRMA